MSELKDFTVLMPISGRGLRFAQQKVNVPKPLIEVVGTPLMNWALNSLGALEMPVSATVIVEHEDTPIFLSPLAPKTEQIAENVFRMPTGLGQKMIIFRETGDRGGAAVTVRKALAGLPEDLVAPGKPLVVTNCDHVFSNPSESNKYSWKDVQSGALAGLIATFPLKEALAAGPAKWSYAVCAPPGQVLAVIEKPNELPAMDWEPTIGVYFFKDAPVLMRAIDTMIEEGLKVNNEFYLAPVYNHIAGEGKIGTQQFDYMRGLGTPEDIDRFVCEFWRRVNTLPE